MTQTGMAMIPATKHLNKIHPKTPVIKPIILMPKYTKNGVATNIAITVKVKSIFMFLP